MHSLWQDLRFGLRLMLKRPGFTAVVVIVLALGIGANAAIFSVVNAVLLRPLKYPDSDRVMTVWEDHTRREGPAREWTSPTGFQDWRDQGSVFEYVAAVNNWGPTLTGAGEPEVLSGGSVSSQSAGQRSGATSHNGASTKRRCAKRGWGIVSSGSSMLMSS